MYRGVCDISEARSQKRKGPSCRSSQSVGICVGHSRLRGLDLEVVILGSQSTDQAMEFMGYFQKCHISTTVCFAELDFGWRILFSKLQQFILGQADKADCIF